MAKTHLDLGFTERADEVADRYVRDFFPRALATAAELRGRGGPHLVWTTGSWVLHHALTNGTVEQRNAVAAGVRRGDLAWHALPLTLHSELADADLIRSGLGISAELDARFGRATSAAKMTDVPGHTRGLVPLLAEVGVTFLHLGVNPAWPVPDVPPVFRWAAPGGAEVVVAYQAGGYGGEVVVPGCGDVLAFLHAGDNLGPPTADEVLAAHDELAARHPGAEVRASTLDAFARALAASGAVAGLPVVTAEIGDPWLFGAGSDPVKVAALRELLDRRRLLADGGRRRSVDRALLEVVEHTWGLDQKVALPDGAPWDRAGLAELRASPAGRRFEGSWDEQRASIDRAAAALAAAVAAEGSAEPPGAGSATEGHHPGSMAAVLASVPRWPLDPDGVPLGGFTALAPGAVVGGGGWQLGVDPATGALDQLVHLATGRELAGSGRPLGLLTYESFDEADYERFYAGLTPSPADDGWARLDNTKPGIDADGAVSGRWHPTVTGTWHAVQRGGSWHTVLLRLAFPGLPTDRLGAPPEAWVRWSWAAAHDEVDLDVWWEQKPANRLPEALWCSFTPPVAEPTAWTIDKLGQAVSPLDVVRRGGRSLHAVGEGMAYAGPEGPLRIRTVDASLVAPGGPDLLDPDPPVPDLAKGFAVLLLDNCWGTNFPMWVEGPARFRFTISVAPPA